MNRKLHRWVSFAAAILFLYVAVTGVILQFQQLFGAEDAHKEAFAHNTFSGRTTIVTGGQSVAESRDGLRLSFQRYERN